MAVGKGEYGVVRAVRGGRGGMVGYYDDDWGDGRAVVYFGRIVGGMYDLVELGDLEGCGPGVVSFEVEFCKRRVPRAWAEMHETDDGGL